MNDYIFFTVNKWEHEIQNKIKTFTLTFSKNLKRPDFLLIQCKLHYYNACAALCDWFRVDFFTIPEQLVQ